MNITGEILVFVNVREYENDNGVPMEKNVFSTSVSKFNEDKGDYDRAYMDVYFSNNLKEAYSLGEYPDGAILKVNVDEGWLVPRVWAAQDGSTRRALACFINGVDSLEEYAPEDDQPQTPAKKAPAKKAPAKKAPAKKAPAKKAPAKKTYKK